MRRLFAAVVLLLASSSALADYGYIWYGITVAQLPSVCTDGQLMAVNNGASFTDCTAGGGTFEVVCQCESNAWFAVRAHGFRFASALPSCTSATEGDAVYYGSTNRPCYCDGSSWLQFNDNGSCTAAAQNWTDSASSAWQDSAASSWTDGG